MEKHDLDLSHVREFDKSIIDLYISRTEKVNKYNANHAKNELGKYGASSVKEAVNNSGSKLKWLASSAFKLFISRMGHPDMVTYQTYGQFTKENDPYLQKVEAEVKWADKTQQVTAQFIGFCKQAQERIELSNDAALAFYRFLLDNADFRNLNWYIMTAVEQCGITIPKGRFSKTKKYLVRDVNYSDPSENEVKYVTRDAQKIRELVSAEKQGDSAAGDA